MWNFARMSKIIIGVPNIIFGGQHIALDETSPEFLNKHHNYTWSDMLNLVLCAEAAYISVPIFHLQSRLFFVGPKMSFTSIVTCSSRSFVLLCYLHWYPIWYESMETKNTIIWVLFEWLEIAHLFKWIQHFIFQTLIVKQLELGSLWNLEACLEIGNAFL